MNLPEFLTEWPYGEIVLTGHRIGLYDVVSLHNEGYTAEMLHDEFPTLPLDLIEKALAFAREHRAQVDAYVTEYKAALDRQYAEYRASGRALDWDGLRKRWDAMQQAERR